MKQLAFAIALLGGAASAFAGPSEGLRYERGDGVSRDYTRALAAYDKACDHGDGDPAACRRIEYLIDHRRGDPAGPLPPLDPMRQKDCDKGDWLSCENPGVKADEAKAGAACGLAHPDACHYVAHVHAYGKDADAGVVRAFLVKACAGHLLEGCMDLVAELHDKAPKEARTAVTAACRAGDADACALDGTPISPMLLCKAHDEDACGKH